MNAGMNDSEIRRYQFNVEQFLKMAEVGILPAEGREELLDGVVWDRSPLVRNRCHPALKGGVTRFLNELAGLDAVFDSQIHKYTAEEYHVMGEVNILTPDERVELVEGEIVEMPPMGSPHASATGRANRIFNRAVGDRAIVWVQNAISLPAGGEPEPDLALLKPRADFYYANLPTPADMLLAVEVSDSTARFDRNVKAPLYALNGIPETWLFLLQEEAVEVCRRPRTEGYQTVMRFHRGESIAPEAFPDLEFSVDELLGPSSEPTRG